MGEKSALCGEHILKVCTHPVGDSRYNKTIRLTDRDVIIVW